MKIAEVLCILNINITFHTLPEDTVGQLQAFCNQADMSPMPSATLNSSQSYCIFKLLNLLIYSGWLYKEGQARKKAEKSLCLFLLDISQYLG